MVFKKDDRAIILFTKYVDKQCPNCGEKFGATLKIIVAWNYMIPCFKCGFPIDFHYSNDEIKEVQ